MTKNSDMIHECTRKSSTSNSISTRGRSRIVAVFCSFIILLAVSPSASSQRQGSKLDEETLPPVASKTNLYPADADAKKEVDKALKQAGADKKRVLLIFGANWCYDCHVLDRALHEGEAAKIVTESFLLVHVDIGEGNKNLDLAKKYKTALDKGVPAVAVLSSDGQLLYSSSDGEFESARKMMKRDLIAFLSRWKDSGR